MDGAGGGAFPCFKSTYGGWGGDLAQSVGGSDFGFFIAQSWSSALRTQQFCERWHGLRFAAECKGIDNSDPRQAGSGFEGVKQSGASLRGGHGFERIAGGM